MLMASDSLRAVAMLVDAGRWTRRGKYRDCYRVDGLAGVVVGYQGGLGGEVAVKDAHLVEEA